MRRRRIGFESLSARRLMAAVDDGTTDDGGPRHNYFYDLDVDGNGVVQPIDALLVVNELRRREAGGIEPMIPTDAENRDGVFYDVNADDQVSPIDLLCVINELRLPPIETVDALGRPFVGPADEMAIRSVGRIDRAAPDDFITTESGLEYRIVRQSPAPTTPPGFDVRVDYKGYLDDGTIFDSSYRRNSPSEFNRNGVIEGFSEGIGLLPGGGMIQIRMPPELGYGDAARPGIPANSTLNFVVELYAFGPPGSL